MKKVSLIAFAAALLIGIIIAGGCGFRSVSGITGIEGSGTLKSERRDVSGFSKIDAGGAVNLEIAAQRDFNVSIEADDNLLEQIKTEVDGDTLKIYTKGNISTKNSVKVTISMPEVKALNVSGASTAAVSNVETNSLNLIASGASRIKISGEIKNLELEASGASTINAEELKVEDVAAEASGASSVTVAPTGELKADASGASSVYYTGALKNIVQNSSGASSIRKK